MCWGPEDYHGVSSSGGPCSPSCGTGACRGAEARRPSVVPTWQLSGASWPVSHVRLEGLLQWGPRSTTGTGGRTVEGERTAGPTEVVGFTPHPPWTPWSHPCPNLTFIEKSTHRGVLFQTSQKTHGQGQLKLGHNRDPDFCRQDGTQSGKRRTSAPFDFKGKSARESSWT